MAYNPGNNSTNTRASAAAPALRRSRTGQEYEAALGFINVYIPTAGGKRLKVGTIALQGSSPTQKQVFDRLSAATTDEERADLVARMASKLQFDFNPQLDDSDPANQVADF